MPSTTPTRLEADRCPGILRLADAADGAIARVRLPGGLISPSALRGLVGAAAELGDPRLEMTSRGNLQVRGLTKAAAADLERVLAELGLLPSRTHERVRNIVASPLAELAPFVRALDAALCLQPHLAELSGRFLFGFDDGSGDIAGLVPDVLAVVADPANSEVEAVVRSMLAEAETFLAVRAASSVPGAWRWEDLAEGRDRLAARPARPSPPAPAGLHRTADGRQHLAVLVPLGRLTRAQAETVARLAGADLRVTPWRSIVIPDVTDGEAAISAVASVGLGAGSDSHWYGLSCCAGRPGCAKSLADVQAEAATAPHEPGVITHWSGCERRCGRPRNTTVDVIATAHGYERIDALVGETHG